MTVKPEFVKGEIERAAKDYEKITLAQEQRDKVVQIARILNRYLPIPEMAMKGFISRAIRDWQVEKKTNFKETISWSQNRQVNLTKEIFDIMKSTLTKSLVKPEQEPALNKALNDALEFLKEIIHDHNQ
ncbi:MAG: hypothetical protein EAX96_17275 [Candidatus Lokiarchaeota archaeon]|nr:hypothetical protein [Candidatus Lokiarchaeota archaeon]